MGWLLWLEWGEYSLVEHTNLAVYVFYPTSIAIIITGFYIVTSSSLERKELK